MSNKTWKKVSLVHSADMAALHHYGDMKIKDLVAMFPQYSQRSVYRHAKRKIGDKEPEDRRKYNKGRPHVMSMRDQRLRVTFTVARLTLEVGLLGKVALRIVRKISTRAATSTSKCGRKADL